MNGLENMTDKILSDAQQYANQVKKDSEAKIDQILLECREEAQSVTKEIISAAQNESEMIVSRANSQAALGERNELMRAKHSMMNNVFSAACDMIVSLPRDEYVELLTRLVAQYQTGPAEIILNRQDAEKIGTELLAKVVVNKIRKIDISMIKISKVHGDFKGGLILRQGDIDTNCTVEVLCEGLRHKLEPQVIKLLQL